MPDGKVGIRIVKFGFVRHLFSLLAQQVSGVQADVRIVNQNAAGWQGRYQNCEIWFCAPSVFSAGAAGVRCSG
ncbi:hypothetical protein [Escherichia coli]|uniref:hypothetical protein n=1 Tax=Escherichia coli TaxID=562 RepID=UPI000FFC823F|nr:hypothetical protein [Escherichia coli]